MSDSTPHYLLTSETGRAVGLGRWRFVLRPVDGTAAIEAEDVEPDIWGERLDLLTVVRALESLDQPSRVTLVGCTRYVEQGVQFGVSEWRGNDWRWEYFGQMAPVRDADLWQRMDQALRFHRVECGQRRIDGPHTAMAGNHTTPATEGNNWINGFAAQKWIKCSAPLLTLAGAAWVEVLSRFWHSGARLLSSSFLLHRS
jgi:ribonuclease HI